MTMQSKPFSKGNPVNGFSGKASFRLGDGRRKNVGLWNEAWSGPEFRDLSDAYFKAVEVAQRRDQERSELAQSRIADGARVVIRERDERLAREHVRSVFSEADKARAAVERARSRIADMRGAMTFKAGEVSPGDIAGAMRRERIRQKLEGMKPDAQREALANADADTIAALAEMPLAFSPVSERLHMQLIEGAFEKENAEALAQIEHLEQASQVALRAAEGAEAIARESLQDRLMLKRDQVEPMIAEITGRADASNSSHGGLGSFT